MVNESGSQFLSTIIVLGFAQDTREPTVYNGLEKSLSTIFVLGFWGAPRWGTQRLWQGWLHMQPLKRRCKDPYGGTQRLWQRCPHMGTPKRLWQGCPIWGHSRGCGRGGRICPPKNMAAAPTQRLWQRLFPRGPLRDCGRGDQFEKRTAFIKYIYSSRSSSRRRIYKTTTTSTTDSFSETEIQCF